MGGWVGISAGPLLSPFFLNGLSPFFILRERGVCAKGLAYVYCSRRIRKVMPFRSYEFPIPTLLLLEFQRGPKTGLKLAEKHYSN